MPEFPEIKGIDTKNFFLADHTFSLVFGVDGGGEGCRRVDFGGEFTDNETFLIHRLIQTRPDLSLKLGAVGHQFI